jgi:chemotaxis signal transduction protein
MPWKNSLNLKLRQNEKKSISAIVAKSNDSFFGLQVDHIVDIATSEEEISDSIRDRPGVVGNAYIRDQNVTIVDLGKVLHTKLSA